MITLKRLKIDIIYWGEDKYPFIWDGEMFVGFGNFPAKISFDEFKPYKQCKKPVKTEKRSSVIRVYKDRISKLLPLLNPEELKTYNNKLIGALRIDNKYVKQLTFLCWYTTLQRDHPDILRLSLDTYLRYSHKIKGDGCNYFIAIVRGKLNETEYSSAKKFSEKKMSIGENFDELLKLHGLV